MVKHVLFCKLKDYSVENANKLRDVFLSMKGNVPVIVDVKSEIDFLRSERSFDVMLEVTLNSREDLQVYAQDKYHCEVVKTYVHSVIACTNVVVDYEY
ncbi:MAG: Dabb family protein [Erysipelotrichaceae bacterium]